jgi:hypothetical protein
MPARAEASSSGRLNVTVIWIVMGTSAAPSPGRTSTTESALGSASAMRVPRAGESEPGEDGERVEPAR